MPILGRERPALPEYMTWEALEKLPKEIAGEIELWDGRVVWVPREPGEHQIFTVRMHHGLEIAVRKNRSSYPESCWRATPETSVFLGSSGKSDFLTPDFMIHRCLDRPYQDVRATDTLLVGEVLSPPNTRSDVEARKARYSQAGIPWYWEVTLETNVSAIARVRAYALETGHAQLPPGVRPLYPANYLLAGEWTPEDEHGIQFAFPFPIHMPWSDLEY